MSLNEQNENIQKISSQFNEVSTIYDIHNARIHAMITYFENVRSIYSKALGKKEKFQISKNNFIKQISGNPNSPIAPGNPSFQIKFAETLINLSKLFIAEFDSTNKQMKDHIIQYLNQLVSDREKKFKEITSKYNDALDNYQKAISNYKSSQQNLTSSLKKLEETQQNWESQQNQVNVPQKSGFNLFHKLKPSKSKTDISGAIQSYRKYVRAAENSIYALNSSYAILIKTANDGMQSFANDMPDRHLILRQALYQFSNVYENQANYHSLLPEYKKKVFQNDEQFYFQNWQDDFISFVQKVRIARLPLRSISFNPKIDSSQASKTTKCYDFPLGFATVVQNFPFLRDRYLTQPDLDNFESKRASVNVNNTPNQESGPASQEPRRQSLHIGSQPRPQQHPPLSPVDNNENNKKHFLQVKQGQRVYYYNNLLDEWVLASLTVNGPRKYVLSSCLEADDTSNSEGMAIVKRVLLNGPENRLSVMPGELLTIVNRPDENNNVLCSNINGQTGMVKYDCILAFKE